MAIRILVVDDHAMVREGLGHALAAQPDFALAGDAGTIAQALELARERLPDVALVDIELSGEETGFSLVSRLRSEHPALRVLVVSAHNKAGYVRSASAAGAHGYVLKEDGLAVLVAAIRLAVHGESAGSEGVRNGPMLWDLLTPRQREVACLLARGFKAPNVAALLGIREGTVPDHRSEVYRKLKVGSPLEVAAYIRDNGIACGPHPAEDGARKPPARKDT